MVEIKRLFYQFVLKRTSTFCLAMVASAMFFEAAYDQACEYIFEKVNDGKLWMHIKQKYEEGPDQVQNLALTSKTSHKELSHEKLEAAKKLKNHKSLEKKKEREDTKTE